LVVGQSFFGLWWLLTKGQGEQKHLWPGQYGAFGCWAANRPKVHLHWKTSRGSPFNYTPFVVSTHFDSQLKKYAINTTPEDTV
jgi:hypothetical protein